MILADGEQWIILGALVVIAGAIIFLAVLARYFNLWIQCIFTRADINIWQLMMMSIRKVNPAVIVRAKIMSVQAGLTRVYPITTRALEAHYLAGGNVANVIRALIAAHRAHIDLDWQTAQAIDLAGRNLLEAVRTSVYPKVIDCPDPKRSAGTLDAVAGDGIRLKARARVTVRTNIRQLVGGATEETIIARVGQGIVQAIGSTRSYKIVLENPERISETVLGQGLEAQTAYEIVSIDIADIDVGENIGARLMADQAEADMRVAQAKAEQRRAAARAARAGRSRPYPGESGEGRGRRSGGSPGDRGILSHGQIGPARLLRAEKRSGGHSDANVDRGQSLAGKLLGPEYDLRTKECAIRRARRSIEVPAPSAVGSICGTVKDELVRPEAPARRADGFVAAAHPCLGARGGRILRKITEAREQAERARAPSRRLHDRRQHSRVARTVAQARCCLDSPARATTGLSTARQSVPQRDRTVSRGSGTPPHSGEWAATGRRVCIRRSGSVPPPRAAAKSDFDAGGPSPYGACRPQPVRSTEACSASGTSKPADAAGGRIGPAQSAVSDDLGAQVRAHLNQYLESSRLSQKARAELGSAIDRAVRDHLGNTRTTIEDQDSPSSAKTGPPIASFLRRSRRCGARRSW